MEPSVSTDTLPPGMGPPPPPRPLTICTGGAGSSYHISGDRDGFPVVTDDVRSALKFDHHMKASEWFESLTPFGRWALFLGRYRLKLAPPDVESEAD